MTLDVDMLIHLFAGGCGGTAGAIATCPLEVVKTRLQSSSANLMSTLPPAARSGGGTTCHTVPHHASRSGGTAHSRRFGTHAFRLTTSQVVQISQGVPGPRPRPTLSLLHCLKYIVEVEGPRALFRGLGPNLVGVAPTRAIYFCSYSQMKKFLNKTFANQNTPFIHIISASTAGFAACTATNPIWFIKTRLQLDHSQYGKSMKTVECIRNIYRTQGILGFYKGIAASYYGISETVIHFVIYEAIKAKFQSYRHASHHNRSTIDFLEFMFAGATSKTTASIICYPHEVARTRLREEGRKYRGFWQTLGLVVQEEGWRGLYRGLAIQLVRQIPNSAIMLATYEAVVYFMSRYCNQNEFYEEVEYVEEEEEYGD